MKTLSSRRIRRLALVATTLTVSCCCAPGSLGFQRHGGGVVRPLRRRDPYSQCSSQRLPPSAFSTASPQRRSYYHRRLIDRTTVISRLETNVEEEELLDAGLPPPPAERKMLPSRVSSLLSRIPRPNGGGKHSSANGKKKALLDAEADLDRLKRENAALREVVLQLETENERLHQEAAGMIVLETFEGEGKLRRAAQERTHGSSSSPNGSSAVTITGEEMSTFWDGDRDDDPTLWCDELEEGACPVEPTVSFGEALRDRAYWLVGLLVLQSLSGIILAHNEALLSNHPVSTYNRYLSLRALFLTDFLTNCASCLTHIFVNLHFSLFPVHITYTQSYTS